jgi:hypothetical protein
VYKVEEKSYLGVRERKRLNTTGLNQTLFVGRKTKVVDSLGYRTPSQTSSEVTGPEDRALFTTEPVSLNFLNGFPNTLSVTEFFTA